MKALPLLAACLALVSLSARAFGMYIPPNSMADLTGADFIAIGRFSNAGGKTEFMVERMIRGDAVGAVARMQAELGANPNLLSAAPDGGLIYYGVATLGWERSDAGKMAVWFLMSGRAPHRVARQPVELAEGFAALLEKKDPSLFFRLLQRLDSDMQRDALEELFANPDKDLVARLHSIALQSDSDLGFQALNVLTQTRLLDVDKVWGRWMSLPHAGWVMKALEKQDAARMTGELELAIAAEKNPVRLEALLCLIPYGSPQTLELTLPYLDHPSDSVRNRVIGTLWNVLWDLNHKAFTSPEAKMELAALGRRLVPLLDKRLKVETDRSCKARLTEMLARADGVPWILRIPRERIEKPIPPYSEEAELKFLVGRLTSHGDRGFIMESAGREIAGRFFKEGFKRLKAAAAATQIYSTGMVYEGMGYVRDQRMFDYLVEHMTNIGPGDGTYESTLEALGVQDNRGSLAAIKRFAKGINENNDRQIDGLAALSDKGTLPYLKEHESEVKYHAQVPYLRARAMHGDPWAVNELLAALQEPPASKFLTKDYWIPQYIVNALCSVDTAEATDALKQSVEQSWPGRSGTGGYSASWARLENYAGTSRRNSPLGEVARRDPQWLTALALRKMADPSLPARGYAADIFQQLTGQLGDYRPEAFAPERIEPLQKLEAWWSAHKAGSREQWLMAYFKDKGFAVDQLDKKSLPVLVRALESDFFTHNLAVEQISVICQKYFTDFRHQDSYQGQKQMNIRVVGWLRARGYLDPEKSVKPGKGRKVSGNRS